jgi:3'-5' exoribonuclease
VLGRILPEFAPLTCLVQHEFFHRYTADEHALVCLEQLDAMLDSKEPDLRKYGELYRRVETPEILVLAVLLHDTGKTIEYEGTLATKRSRRGILQRHVVLGYQLVRKAGLKAKLDNDLLERLEHIVLSHQGEPEWGAAVYAATPEAVFVSMIDNLDAKMGMVQRLLRQAGDTDQFSERHFGLNAQLLLSKPGK